MVEPNDFEDVVAEIRAEDSRFAPGAYYFVRKGLDYTLKRRQSKASGPGGHVSGQELLAGIRAFALEQYGPMAAALFEQWGLSRCEDFGEIVFQLVEKGVLGKTETDSLDDFRDGYTFHEAFVEPFLPKRATAS